MQQPAGHVGTHLNLAYSDFGMSLALLTTLLLLTILLRGHVQMANEKERGKMLQEELKRLDQKITAPRAPEHEVLYNVDAHGIPPIALSVELSMLPLLLPKEA